jgi:hypothetical protein
MSYSGIANQKTTQETTLRPGLLIGLEIWLFSIRLVEVKRFQASAPLCGLMFPVGPRFSSG